MTTNGFGLFFENVVGGYAVTGRMLKMFRRKVQPPAAQQPAGQVSADGQAQVSAPSSPNGRA